VVNNRLAIGGLSNKKREAIKQYRAFVSEGRNQPKPYVNLRNQIYLGDDAFVDEMQCKISPDTNLSEVPSSQKRQVAKSLAYYEKNIAIELRLYQKRTKVEGTA